MITSCSEDTVPEKVESDIQGWSAVIKKLWESPSEEEIVSSVGGPGAPGTREKETALGVTENEFWPSIRRMRLLKRSTK